MIKAHIDVPGARCTVHRNPNCPGARVGPESRVRHLLLNADTISRELNRFRDGAHGLADEAGRGELWLILDFLDPAFEEALAGHVWRLVGLHHRRPAGGGALVHC